MPYQCTDRISDRLSPAQYNAAMRCLTGGADLTKEVDNLIQAAKASYPSQCPRANTIAQIARIWS